MRKKRRQSTMPSYDASRVSAETSTGPVRQVNEDALFIPDEGVDTQLGALFIVADGVGGQEHGRDAAALAVQSIPNSFYQMRQRGNGLSASLSFALKQANQLIYQEAQRRGAGRMGCTVVAAAQHQERLYVAHVGDARAYMVRKGKLKRLTRDHTWVQEQVEAGALTVEEAAAHELRNVITRALGNHPEVEVELSGPYQMERGDSLLLCSDGLYDVVPDRQIHRTLVSSPYGQAARRLVGQAVRAGAEDNVTAVVIGARGDRRSFGQLLASSLPGGIPLILVFALLSIGAFLVLLLLNTRPILPPPTTATGIVEGPPAATATDLQAPAPTLSVTITATMTTGSALLAPGEQVGTPRSDTQTAVASATYTFTEGMAGCVFPEALFWADNLLEETGTLCSLTNVRWPEDPAARLLTDPQNPVTIEGSTGNDACGPSPFVKVQSKHDPELVGWVNAANVYTLAPGQTQCTETP